MSLLLQAFNPRQHPVSSPLPIVRGMRVRHRFTLRDISDYTLAVILHTPRSALGLERAPHPSQEGLNEHVARPMCNLWGE